ncbi:MAG: DUF1015 domain-containing protein [Clostridia bacterium]|nr:DUF1015 domain-containing protein [Clostridia bacterium]
MAIFRPFRALRPVPELVSKIAALPYDVMSTYEAAEIAKLNPHTFLRIDRAEINFPAGINPYDEQVYEKAAELLQQYEDDGLMEQDSAPCFYILEQTLYGRTQTGLVGCASIDDYRNNVIKRHENTTVEKSKDRICHVRACNANTGPIFLTYPGDDTITDDLYAWKSGHKATYEFITPEEVRVRAWAIDDPELNASLTDSFRDIPSLYIADGHHRCNSAVEVGLEKRKAAGKFTGAEEFNYFLAIAFPSEELAIMDYNRVARLPEGMTKETLFSEISKYFTVEEQKGLSPYRPDQPKTFGMYVFNNWYKLTARDGTFNQDDPVERLDVSVLQDNLIGPVLGITDLRNDKRIDFVGGARGLRELEHRVHTDMNIAFSMYPTSIEDLISVADAGRLMPPKSTWFEPKLLSGMFIHKLD